MDKDTLRKPPKWDKRCGDTSGYYVHKRKKETPCQPCKDALARYSKEWRAKNPEKSKIYIALAHARYPERDRAKGERWRLANLEKSRLYSRINRARRASAPSEPYTVQQILDLHGANCYLCKEPIDLEAPRSIGKKQGWKRGLHLDHVIPLSRGGSDLIVNIRPSHALCNLTKSNNLISGD